MKYFLGLNPTIMEFFKIKINTMNKFEKQVVLAFDEMKIKPSLHYDSVHDEVEGFEDYGCLGRTKNIATHSLVFMISGLCFRWKQPFAYYLAAVYFIILYCFVLIFATITCISST